LRNAHFNARAHRVSAKFSSLFDISPPFRRTLINHGGRLNVGERDAADVEGYPLGRCLLQVAWNMAEKHEFAIIAWLRQWRSKCPVIVEEDKADMASEFLAEAFHATRRQSRRPRRASEAALSIGDNRDSTRIKRNASTLTLATKDIE